MPNNHYQPSAEIIQKYAQVLINFALNSGKGLQKDEVVEISVPDVAKPMALALQNEVLRSGGHPLTRILPTGFDQDYYSLAQDHQLRFFPKKYLQSKAKLLNHQVQILADPFPEELKTIHPQKIIQARDSKKPYRDWLTDKENQGNFTWTLALWGVPAKAELVGLSLQEYWHQIIQACFLDEDDPIARWQEVTRLQTEIKHKLNALEISKIIIEGDDLELTLSIGKNRQWQGGGGRNIPSFEIFTSPDWRGTEGWIKINQPVYRYGNVISDVLFEFRQGLVTQAEAQQGNEILQAMIASPNANKLGEFSLTDSRMSRITHPMAEILFDENMGGEFGNTHIAIGSAYKECYANDTQDISEIKKQEWEELGFNDSAEHTDFISTSDRTVTAILPDGTKKVIYKQGRFCV